MDGVTPYLDSGVATFMIFATVLVMIMTPGLAFFYGGLTCRKNVINVMMQTFVSLGITSILWFAFGYSLCFSGDYASGTDFLGVLGNLDLMFLNGIDLNTLHVANTETGAAYPELIFVAYQMMFAVITPALITGAFINRITFKSYLIFLVLWQIFVYYPFVHMVWGNGILAHFGALDFAGGIVVHATAGFAALASVIYVGKRLDQFSRPNSIALIAVGTAMLWFGWYGFNGGSALDVNGTAALAFFNTHLSAATAAVVWMIIEWIANEKRPTLIGVMTGAVAGLATITPAAGFVSTPIALLIGVLAGVGCFLAVSLKNKMQWDDALDVWGVHGMGGFIGTICLALFGTVGATGLFMGDGGSEFFLIQMIALVLACVVGFGFTYALLVGINIFTPVKVSDEEQEIGLDIVCHGEKIRT